MSERFYVYRIFNITGTIYIGKGSGRRLAEQKRRFGADGEIIAEFASEAAAYRAERRLIAKVRPSENRDNGGCGGWSDRKKPIPNGLTPEGLHIAAPHLARIIRLSKEYPGLWRIIAAYVKAHGVEAIVDAVRPFFAPLKINNLVSDSRP